MTTLILALLVLALGTGTAIVVSVQTQRLSGAVNYANQHDALTAMIDGGAVALAAKRFDAQTRRQRR